MKILCFYVKNKTFFILGRILMYIIRWGKREMNPIHTRITFSPLFSSFPGGEMKGENQREWEVLYALISCDIGAMHAHIIVQTYHPTPLYSLRCTCLIC